MEGYVCGARIIPKIKGYNTEDMRETRSISFAPSADSTLHRAKRKRLFPTPGMKILRSKSAPQEINLPSISALALNPRTTPFTSRLSPSSTLLPPDLDTAGTSLHNQCSETGLSATVRMQAAAPMVSGVACRPASRASVRCLAPLVVTGGHSSRTQSDVFVDRGPRSFVPCRNGSTALFGHSHVRLSLDSSTRRRDELFVRGHSPERSGSGFQQTDLFPCTEAIEDNMQYAPHRPAASSPQSSLSPVAAVRQDTLDDFDFAGLVIVEPPRDAAPPAASPGSLLQSRAILDGAAERFREIADELRDIDHEMHSLVTAASGE